MPQDADTTSNEKEPVEVPGEAVVESSLESLLECASPLLVGVRHHSAALARTLPEMLEAFRPERIYLELPPDFEPWLPWMASETLEAPIALAAGSASLNDLCFYPFADFSPELVAIRWGFANEIPVTPFDLPIDRRSQTVRSASQTG